MIWMPRLRGFGLFTAALAGALSSAPALAESAGGAPPVASIGTASGIHNADATRIVVGGNVGAEYRGRCYKKGKPVADRVTFSVSGAPNTGGATATFTPNPVASFSYTKFKINTTQDTKPGKYVMTVSATGPKCGLYGTAEVDLDLAPLIKGDSYVWWFDREKPTGYDTSLTLFALGPGGQPYTWTITRGDSARFGKQAANTVEIVGLKGSKARDDVGVKVSVDGVDSDEFALTVKAPHTLDFVTNRDKADGKFGYKSSIYYEIDDQFGKPLPSNVPIHQRWTSAVQRDTASDWTSRPNPSGTVVGRLWADAIVGEISVLPPAQAPQSPLGTRKMLHWDGDWWVGTASTSGATGERVSQNTWQKFRDHGRHTDIKTPAP